MPLKKNDPELIDEVSKMTRLSTETQYIQQSTESLQKSDPSCNYKGSNDAVEQDLQGLLQRGTCAYGHEDDIPKDANVLGGRLVINMKQTGTEKENIRRDS